MPKEKTTSEVTLKVSPHVHAEFKARAAKARVNLGDYATALLRSILDWPHGQFEKFEAEAIAELSMDLKNPDDSSVASGSFANTKEGIKIISALRDAGVTEDDAEWIVGTLEVLHGEKVYKEAIKHNITAFRSAQEAARECARYKNAAGASGEHQRVQATVAGSEGARGRTDRVIATIEGHQQPGPKARKTPKGA